MGKDSKIFIAGHNAMIVQTLSRCLRKRGFCNLFMSSPSCFDLTDQKVVRSFFQKHKPEYCFLTTVKEGGVGANITYPADLIYQNLAAQVNVIHSAWQTKVKKLLFFASSCVYPKNSLQPMKEEYLLTGPLEPSNEPYAAAKIAGIKMCQAYNKQFGTKFISVIPATIFGPEDNFNTETSHVIPALIHKFHEAKIKNKKEVVIWGSGRPKREFIYINEVIDASIFVLEHADSLDFINIGTGADLSIRKLSAMIKSIIGFSGRIKFDVSKPDGVYRKLLDVSRLNSLGWRSKMSFQSGLEMTYKWYERYSRLF